jgi:hypothetical protein
MSSSIDWAWLAGLFEGEGCFLFTNVNSVGLAIESTDQDILARVQSIAGGTLNGPYAFESKIGKKPTWRWTLHQATSVAVALQRLKPHLGQRRLERLEEAQARLVNCRGRRGRA